MKRTPESLWRSAGMKYLKLKLGARIGWHYRTIGQAAGRSGVPDDLFLVNGLFVAIEWKRPGYKPSGKVTQQDIEIDAIKKAGGIACKVSCMSELDDCIGLVLASIVGQNRGHFEGVP